VKRSLIILAVLLIAAINLAFAAGEPAVQETVCSFADGKGMRVQYTPLEFKLRNGEPWTPGDKPLTLFTDTPITLGNTPLPAGAYGLYLVPEKQTWTLVVNKTAKPGQQADKSQDIVRAPMQSGDLGHNIGTPQVTLVHPAQTQCSLQVYAGSTLAWADFKEQGQ
jgi:hypothetical protein